MANNQFKRARIKLGLSRANQREPNKNQMSEEEYRAEWLSARNAPASWLIVTTDEVEELKRALEKLERERDELSSRFDGLAIAYDSRENELRTLRAEVERLKDNSGELKREIQRLASDKYRAAMKDVKL